MKKFLWILYFLLLISVGTPVSAFSDRIYKDLETFSKILQIVDQNYVEEVDEKTLLTGAIRGMLMTLDPHTVYFSTEVYQDFKSDTEGRFGGVGIEVSIKEGLITVISPIEGSPAARAGIETDDKILMINGKITKGMDLGDAVHMMRGPIGRKLTLSVWHKGMKQPREVELTREVIKVASVLSEDLGGNIAYFRITSFQDGTGKSLAQAIEKYKTAHDGVVTGMLLDLRDNPGGLLSEAVNVADLFLDDGVIVSTKGRDKVQEVHRVTKKETRISYPLVVLINGGSASAAEIVAGALQDQERAKLVGTRSYGKGSVQTVINLDDGDALKMTIARYYTPKNRMIDGKGISPNVWAGKNEFKKKLQSAKQTIAADSKEEYEAYRLFQKQEALTYLKKVTSNSN